MSARLRETKAMNAKNVEILRGLLKKDDANKLCVDCKRNDARWASTNLGVFLCIRCSGIHRGLGVHISRVRSVDLDTWSPEQIRTMERWGNARANVYWEAHLKPGHEPPEHKIEQFIRSKYESKRWAMEGPMPEPESIVLPGGAEPASAPVTSPTSSTGAPPPKVKSPSTSRSTAIDLLGGAFGESTNSSSSAKASPSLAYPQPPSGRTSGLTSPVNANSQSQALKMPAALNIGSNNQAKAAPVATSNSNANNGNGLFDLDFNAPATTNNNNTTTRKNANDIMSLFGNSASVSSPPTQSNSNANTGLDAFASLNLGGAGTSSWSSPSSNNAYSNPPAQAQQQNNTNMYGQAAARPASNSISAANPWAAPAAETSPYATSTKTSQVPSNFYASPPPPPASSKPPAYAASTDFFGTSTSTAQSHVSPPSNSNNNTTSSMDFFNSQDIWGSNNASNNNTNSKSSNNDGFGGFTSSSTGKTGGGFDDLWN